MLSFFRGIKLNAVALAAAAMLSVAATPSQAHTGRVYINILKAGFIVGVGGGSGVLIYEGHRYRLSVGGLGIGSLGIAHAKLAGTAYNLRSPEDITGTYGAAGAGAAFISGASTARLQNGKGVVLELHGVQFGFQVHIGLAGMTIVLH